MAQQRSSKVPEYTMSGNYDQDLRYLQQQLTQLKHELQQLRISRSQRIRDILSRTSDADYADPNYGFSFTYIFFHTLSLIVNLRRRVS